MERTADGYRLSSGREFYANDGLVSIARNDDGTFSIREGYDGGIDGLDEDEILLDDEKAWTPRNDASWRTS